jgi:hypothetical protein
MQITFSVQQTIFQLTHRLTTLAGIVNIQITYSNNNLPKSIINAFKMVQIFTSFMTQFKTYDSRTPTNGRIIKELRKYRLTELTTTLLPPIPTHLLTALPNSFYIPSFSTHLLSPQHWARSARNNKSVPCSTRCITYDNYVQL